MQTTVLLGKTATGKTWKQTKLSINELYNMFMAPKIITKQVKSDWIVFASAKNNQRKATSINKFHGVIIDFDGCEYSIDEMSDCVKQWSHLIHTSYSQGIKPGNRFHLFLPLKKSLSKSKYRSLARYVISLFPDDAKADACSMKDLQIMFMPACPKKTKDLYQVRVRRRPVYLELDPDVEFEMDQLEEEEKYEEREEFTVSDEPIRGERNEYFNRLAGKLINVGFSRSQALHTASAYNSTLSDPLPLKEIRTTILSTYKTHKQHNKDSGWGFDELVERIQKIKDYEKALDLIVKSWDKLSKFEFDKIIFLIDEKFDTNETRQDINMLIGLSDDLDDWTYLIKDHILFNTRIYDTIKIEAFNNVTNGSPKSFKDLIANGRLKVADKFQFNPAEELIYLQDKILYVNTYQQPDIKMVKGNVDIMLDHFKYIVENEAEREVLLDYIAFLVQNPGKKVRWMPVIKGRSGIGKSIIVHKFLTPILGRNNLHHIDNNSMVGDSFNSWQLDCQLIVFHELKLGRTQNEKKQLTDSLKSFITDEYFMAHRKRVDAYQVENHANILAFTNEEDAISITMDERRYCMMRSEAEPKPDDYYEDLKQWARKNANQMYYFFKVRDLQFFTPNSLPRTVYTDQIKQQSYLWPKSVLLSCMEDKEHILASNSCVTLAYLFRLVQYESNGTKDADRAAGLGKRGNNQNTLFVKDIEELGFRKLEGPKGPIRVYDKRTGKQEMVYKTPRHKNEDLNIKRSKKECLETPLPEQELWD